MFEGVTDKVNDKELEGIATSPSMYYWVKDFGALQNIVDNIVSETCKICKMNGMIIIIVVAASNVYTLYFPRMQRAYARSRAHARTHARTHERTHERTHARTHARTPENIILRCLCLKQRLLWC